MNKKILSERDICTKFIILQLKVARQALNTERPAALKASSGGTA